MLMCRPGQPDGFLGSVVVDQDNNLFTSDRSSMAQARKGADGVGQSDEMQAGRKWPIAQVIPGHDGQR